MREIRKFYQLTKVNSWGEEIDYINKEFQSEEEAWNYLKNVERIKSRKGWEVQFCTMIPVERYLIK